MMSFETQTTRIEQLVWLISGTKTGTADELAKKMGVSRRTLFRDLDFLRGRGFKSTSAILTKVSIWKKIEIIFHFFE
jgi:predicted DNA-binding transcriptional regulator YafY